MKIVNTCFKNTIKLSNFQLHPFKKSLKVPLPLVYGPKPLVPHSKIFLELLKLHQYL